MASAWTPSFTERIFKLSSYLRGQPNRLKANKKWLSERADLIYRKAEHSGHLTSGFGILVKCFSFDIVTEFSPTRANGSSTRGIPKPDDTRYSVASVLVIYKVVIWQTKMYIETKR